MNRRFFKNSDGKSVKKQVKRSALTVPSPITGSGVTGKAQNLNKLAPYRVRQLCFPSSTTFTLTGTGGNYTPATGLLQGTTNTLFWSLYFRLADLSQANSDFGPMFDQYMIPEVKVSFFPQMVVNYQGASGFTSNPVYTAVDYDDSSVLSAFNNIFEYQNCQVHNPYKPFSVVLKPRVALPSGSGFANTKTQWIDMADQSVQHYGLKGVFAQTSSATSWVIVCEYIVLLRSVR